MHQCWRWGGGGNLGDGSDASPFLDFDAPDRSPLRKVCHVHDDRHGKQIFFYHACGLKPGYHCNDNHDNALS